jgi:hypothetical protein
MSNRAAFASILAGALLATVSLGAARSADDCLSAPNAPTAGGSHWYYRIERTTKRHCWYLREQGEKLSQIRGPSSRSAGISGQQTETTPQRSIADAHAELPAPSRFEQPIRHDAPVAAMQVEAAVGEPREPASPDALAQQPSVVGTRWPDPSAVISQVNPVVMERRASPAATNSMTPKLASNSVAAPMPPVAATSPAAAESASLHRSRSVPMLLGAVAAASALAAIVGSIVLKFGGAARSRELQIRTRRRVNWEWTDDDHPMISDKSGANLLPGRSGFDRDLHRTADRNRTIADPFSQLTRRAPS